VDRLKVDVNYKPDAKAGWVPATWSSVERYPDGALRLTVRATVTDYDINRRLDKSEFDIAFPPGTYVHDDKAGAKFIQKEKGEKREIAPSEMRLPYEELISTPTKSSYAGLHSWLVVAGGIVLAVSAICIVVFWRRRRSTQDGARLFYH